MKYLTKINLAIVAGVIMLIPVDASFADRIRGHLSLYIAPGIGLHIGNGYGYGDIYYDRYRYRDRHHHHRGRHHHHRGRHHHHRGRHHHHRGRGHHRNRHRDRHYDGYYLSDRGYWRDRGRRHRSYYFNPPRYIRSLPYRY